MLKCCLQYSLAINDFKYGENIEVAMETLSKAKELEKKLELHTKFSEDWKAFKQNSLPLIIQIEKQYLLHTSTTRKKLMRNVSIAAFAIGAISLAVVYLRKRNEQ